MRTVIRDTFPVTAKVYWDQVFFDRDFQLRMYREALGCPHVEILAATGEGAWDGPRTRRLVFQQPLQAPAAVQKLFGAAMRMEERGQFDPASQRWTFQMITEQMPERIQIRGQTWLAPVGESAVERVCELDFAVSIFGVGAVVERFMVAASAENYAKQTRFVRGYLREKGLA